MSSFAERLKKKSALNLDNISDLSQPSKPKIESREGKRKEESPNIPQVEKKSLKKDIEKNDSLLELERIKLELEKTKKAYQRLEGIRTKPFKEYKGRTYRITESQTQMLRSFANNLRKDVDRYENITLNSFLRAILANIEQRKDELDFDLILTEKDIEEEVSKLFK
jgi:hypothetical protein